MKTTGPGRAVSVLKLFTLDKPAWTVEEAAGVLRVSVSSAYRYFASLTESGLLTTFSSGRYTLGPAIIQYDRQIQLTDPLLRAAKPVMDELAQRVSPSGTVLLCRIFRDTVLCVHQVGRADSLARLSYERGRPMPLFKGATSKVILANLLPRDLRRLYDKHHTLVASAALGNTWDAFRGAMAQIRRAGHVVSQAELDHDRIGIAAPILDNHRRAMASLSYVVPAGEQRLIPQLAGFAMTGARRIEDGVDADAAAAGSAAREEAA